MIPARAPGERWRCPGMAVLVLEGDEVDIVEVEDEASDDVAKEDEGDEDDDRMVEVGWGVELGIEVSLKEEEDIAEVVTLIILDDDGVTLGWEEVAVETGELRPP